MTDAAHSFMIGAHFEGRYRIEAELGAGGVGAVYRAVHLKLNRPVALKVLQERYGASIELRQRFEREAKALAALSHPNIVTVTDYGVSGGTPYLVMELLEGESLEQKIEAGAMDPDEALEIALQILRALAFVHGQGLVHRDMKPANVFLQRVPDSKPHVKLLDFGLAKFLEAEGIETTLTRAGQVFGTPSYMAPEQVAGQETDARADVYAMGIMLFEMLSGRRPYEGDASEVMRKHLVEPLPSLNDICPDRTASADLEELLRKATSKFMRDRLSSAMEFMAAIEALPKPALLIGSGPAASLPRGDAPTVAVGRTSGDAATVEPPRERAMTRPSIRASRPPSRLGTVIWVLLMLAVIVGIPALIRMLQSTPGSSTSTKAADKPLPAPPSVALISSATPPATQAAPAARADGPAAQPGAASGAPTSAANPAKGAPWPDPSPLWKEAPKLLRDTHEAVYRGVKLSKRTITYLYKYNAKNSGDPRGHLLLAIHFMNRGYRSDALTAYMHAYELNPDVRGEPRMLEDLIKLVVRGSKTAGEFLKTVYGSSAVPQIDRAIEHVSADRQSADRLRRLKEEIGK